MAEEIHNERVNGAIDYVKEIKEESNSERELMNLFTNYYLKVKSDADYY